jgi:hypothetical protein
MAAPLNRLRWYAHRAVERGGLPAVLAFVLALGGVVGWFAWAQPLADQVVRLQQDNAQLHQRLAQAAKQPRAAAPVSEAQRLSEFVATFPSDKGIPTTFALLHGMAARHGLSLAQAEFRLVAQANEPLARYSMLLPVKADYPNLRAFVNELLREVPSIALEEVNLRRDDLKTELIDARLRLVMFLSRAG